MAREHGQALEQLGWLGEDMDGWDYDEEGEPKRAAKGRCEC
jgi:hypothetical protein